MSGPAPAEVYALVDELPDEFALTSDGRGNCIEASRLAVAAWRRMGLDCKPVACDVMAFNSVARVLHSARVPIREWPEFAWSVGVRSGGRDEHDGTGREPFRRFGWGGHVVVHGVGWFADLTAVQFNRPAKRIHVPGAVVGPLVDDVGVEHPLDDGGLIRWYWRPELRSYRSTPAWRQDVERRPLDELIECVRERMEAATCSDR